MASGSHLLNDDTEKKKLLQEAEQAFGEGKYWECLVACRKAFYLEFEHRFDVQGLAKDDLLAGLASDAPYYAREEGYVENNVRNPFDYIVRDHRKIDADLAKHRGLTTAYIGTSGMASASAASFFCRFT